MKSVKPKIVVQKKVESKEEPLAIKRIILKSMRAKDLQPNEYMTLPPAS